MPVITRALLRKRSEHNEGIISTLEEISLHQEELESINEVLGGTCRKLKIVYLQNNIIAKMENLVHLKDLEYLNLALNNISRIEGLQNCEFLYKLDLTANFIDVDELEDSIKHLAEREKIRDLYMMGNPSQANWPGFESYVVALIPQLHTLDGKEITRSMQISARQRLPALERELRALAAAKRSEKAVAAAAKAAEAREAAAKAPPAAASSAEVVCEDVDSEGEGEDGVSDRDKMTENTPETRVEIYRELAAQKKEKEDREKANKPRERNYEEEQQAAVALLREKELEMGGDIKQKNEGGWTFKWDEEHRLGYISLEVGVARYLDSSLIDVDIHPTYISIIIKGKTLRLRLPAEVKVSECKCQRSKASGSLLVIMPKVNPKENAVTIRGDVKARGASQPSLSKSRSSSAPGTSALPKKMTLQEQMMQAALEASAGAKATTSSSTPSSSSSSSLLSVGTGTSSKAMDLSKIVTKKSADGVDKESFGVFGEAVGKISAVTPAAPAASLVQELTDESIDDLVNEAMAALAVQDDAGRVAGAVEGTEELDLD